MIPFNKPYLTGHELRNIEQAHRLGQLSGDGYFTKQCKEWLEIHTGSPLSLLTHSCTGALEMAAMLIDINAGDEIILPSYTFVSTVNAFVLRGAVPVFVDIRPDTLNLDEDKIEAAIGPKTKAIVPVHYAGNSCNMTEIMNIARNNGLYVIEDAAQALMSDQDDIALGSIGDFGCFSFHETKNIQCGEGGALLVNNQKFLERAEILREKGTNRSKFFRGEVDKYTWVDIGSSYLPGELTSAFLYAQLMLSKEITSRRLAIWHKYNQFFSQIAEKYSLSLPSPARGCRHNAHMYYILLPNEDKRDAFIQGMKDHSIQCVFHYIPLHSSPASKQRHWSTANLPITDSASSRLVRLPLWLGLEPQLDYICSCAEDVLNRI